MAGAGEPVADAGGEFFGGHAGAGECDEVEKAFVVVSEKGG